MLFLSRTLPVLAAFAFGVVAVAIFYIPHPGAQEVERELALWLRIVFAFAYFLGLFSLLNLHWSRIRQRVAGWGYNAVALASFGVMFLFVVHNDGAGPFAPQAAEGAYQWMFQYRPRPLHGDDVLDARLPSSPRRRTAPSAPAAPTPPSSWWRPSSS